MSPDVGDDVLGFHLVRRLDVGSGPALYLAHQKEPDRIAAVKISPIHEAATEEAIHRQFVRYARIDHPNLLPIYAMDTIEGSRVVAMRYVEGGDLATMIRRDGPLAFHHAARLLRGIAAGLDAIHAAGMVHGDVKPSNVLLEADRGPWLADPAPVSFVDASGTDRPVMLTVDYAAPEVIRRDGGDRRSDVYSLGCLVFECLTGRVPFPRDEPEHVMSAHLRDMPSAATGIRDDLPPAIDGILRRAMAKDRDDRYQTAGAFADAVSACQDQGALGIAANSRAGLLAPSLSVAAALAELEPAAGESDPSLSARPTSVSITTTFSDLEPAAGGSEPSVSARPPSVSITTTLSEIPSRPILAASPPMERPPSASITTPVMPIAAGPLKDPVASGDRLEADAALEGDRVDCSVHCPPRVQIGTSFLVQVWAHLVEDADRVAGLATELDSRARLRTFRTLEAKVPRGTRISFDLRVPGCEVEDPVQSLAWSQRAEVITFEVRVPISLTEPPTVIGTVGVAIGGVPIGHLKFVLEIAAEASPAEVEPAAGTARRYRTAFISYATADRDKVLPRVQMLHPLGIEFFQDVMSLEPGERWEPAIYDGIDRCDVFLLFWSSEAKASEWVRRETRRALDRQAGEDGRPPEIRPILIEGPPVPRPWSELEHLHFGDRSLSLLAVPPGLG